ncbi:MAG: RNA methyltransferase [Bacteroidota bacterium]|nr:RNA methyltransferase [Bacteroidota bacterium]MDP4232282.1 RNA methyltransferase [Bacteroidota bacterium]MDP4241421.1 RNA methyltransferase [Bacteroidota bacterium]MDP4286755.1 RNA methyltransferase [Bacteroidota bacterium]
MSYQVLEAYDPEAVEDFRSLKGKGGHFDRGLFIAESEKIVRKILESTAMIPKALMTPEHFESFRNLLDSRTDSTEVYLAPKQEMEQIVGYLLHQGVMLAVQIPETQSIEEAALHWRDPFVVVALDGISDAENMGAIIRTAAAFGASALIVDDRCCNPYLRRSVRVSMGTIVDIEIVRVPDLAVSLRALRDAHHCRIIGTGLTASSIPLSELESAANNVLVFGSEGWGLRPEVIKACDQLVRIPMNANIDSLNVVVASGIVLYEMSQCLNREIL